MIKNSLSVMVIVLLCAIRVFSQQTEIIYLSGTDKDHTVAWDFYCTKGRNSGSWQKIAVPSNWECQGFGTYHYGWEENYKDNESGLYRHRFLSQPSWKGKIVRLVFEGAMTDTEVKINGKPAGPVHRGSFYRFKYDITSLLKNENLLEVKVDKISADTSVNRAERMSDYWVFGGIFRPVYLEILPQQFIDWTAIDAKADGSFLMEVYPLHAGNGFEVEAQILSFDGQPVGTPFSVPVKKGEAKVTLTTRIDRPATWNPEEPNLYKVEVRLKKAGHTVHAITERFGFRTVDFREGVGIFVNGKKVMFKGVNRHSAWPTSGRTMSKEISIMDVNLIKAMNMNAVRMSHYPPDEHFLDVCDSLGLFVLDELGGWQKKYDTPVGRTLLKEMVMKDVNHPSIVIWDNGNEGGNNWELDDDFAKYDPQKRHVIHPWNVFRGTDTQHYKGYGCCAGSLYNGTTVFFPTEIVHGLYDGGHGAGLNDHWNLMRSNPLSAGCFLWVFADEGVVRTDKDSLIDVKGNRAPDGIVGPFREKEGSFYTIREIWSPVYIKEQRLVREFEGTLSVENRYHYTNLNRIKFNWRLVKLSGPHGEPAEQVLHAGDFMGPSIEPQGTGKIMLGLPSGFREADALYLTATDQHGREIFTWSWPLKTPEEINDEWVGDIIIKTEKAAFAEDGEQWTVSSNGVKIGFDRVTGRLASVENKKGKISFREGPVLSVGKADFISIKHYQQDSDYVVEMNYSGNLKQVRYTMMANGILKLEYAYTAPDNYGNGFDYLGINFKYPEDKITGVKFLGRGPYRVWKNRMKGGMFGVWNKPYNNTVTGESWDYPEFKGYYRDFNWVVVENKEQPFTIFTDTENIFLRLYTPAKPVGATNDFTSPPFPQGDISFLHGISAIGTKFDSAENHGPESQKNKVGWEWIRAVVYFDFRPHGE